MDFVSNQAPQIQDMLKCMGMETIDELFVSIPKNLLKSHPQEDDGLSEFEGLRLMENLAAKNTFLKFDSYLGAGSYEHHIPALVSAICQKSEFLTAYTPYQAEASQGMLQAIFEFQSAICALTGMDVANASVYDGASACAEALLMAIRHQKTKNKVIILNSVHPHYRAVAKQYLHNQGVEIEYVAFESTLQTTLATFKKHIDDKTAAVLIQSPNFFGNMEPVQQLAQEAKRAGILTILCANPLSFALYKSAAEQEVDIAVGDCQPLGLPLQYGGPYVGYMACQNYLLRQLPGRLVGETVDTKGNRGFVLTFQAREQHIRRDKATSNICTNQALAALATLVAMLYYGPTGLAKLSLTNYQRTAYLRSLLSQNPRLKILSSVSFFNEFVVQFDVAEEVVQTHFRQFLIEPGLSLSRYFQEMTSCFLIAVTETKSQAMLDRFAEVALEIPT